MVPISHNISDESLIENIVDNISVVELPSSAWISANNISLITSCWQKSIRRGRVEDAVICALALHAINPDYVWRRIRIIALEDISLGDIEIVAQILAIAGKRTLQAKIGESRLLVSLTSRMAGSIKSRTACDLISWATAHAESEVLRQSLAVSSPQNWLALFAQQDLPLWQAAVIVQLIAGHTERAGQRFITLSRPSSSLRAKLLDVSDVPPMVRYVAEKGGASYGLNIALVLAWLQSKGKGVVKYNPARSEASEEMIGNMPAYSYCMYSGLGQAAFRLFMKSKSELRNIFEESRLIDPLLALGYLVFQVEGAFLAKANVFDSSLEITQSSDCAELTKIGFQASRLEFLQKLTIASIPLINLARKSIEEDSNRQQCLF